jgi:hypothetical protein
MRRFGVPKSKNPGSPSKKQQKKNNWQVCADCGLNGSSSGRIAFPLCKYSVALLFCFAYLNTIKDKELGLNRLYFNPAERKE